MNRPTARVPYTELYFGKSDSKNEWTTQRDDFIRSYVDLDHTVDKVVHGDRTLILGPKGTGKSALAWYLQATGATGRHMAAVRDASNLPLSDIPNLRTGQPAGIERTVVAWKLILLANYLDLVLSDSGVRIPSGTEARRAVRALRDFGFLGADSGRALLRTSGKVFRMPIDLRSASFQNESSSELNIYSLVPHLSHWSATAKSSRRHILLLDGLDSIYLNDEKYDESMAALMQAWYSINQELRSARASGSVVLLIRNDVFSRISLSLPDSQKMRDDEGIQLDWRVFSGGLEERAPLVVLANRKAGHDRGIEEVDVLSYFPSAINTSTNSSNPRMRPRLQHLLNLTRHTPRDLLRLFDEIRKVAAVGAFSMDSGDVLPQTVIKEGILRYCNDYFVNAIRNEFAGFERGPQEAGAALETIEQVASHRFIRTDFRQKLAQIQPALAGDVDRLLRLLFFAGAIGNLVPGAARNYAQFYHRRDNAQIHLQGPLILHNALVHAWGLPFERY